MNAELLYESSNEELNAEVVALQVNTTIKRSLVRSVIEKIENEVDANATVTMKITPAEVDWYTNICFSKEKLQGIAAADIHRTAFSLLLIRYTNVVSKAATGNEYVVEGREILENKKRIGVELTARNAKAVIPANKNDEPRI